MSPIRTTRLSLRMGLLVLAVSAFVTLVSTALALWVGYDESVERVALRVDQVRGSHIPALRESLWETDEEQIQVHIGGLLQLPDVEEVELERPDGPTLVRGAIASDRVLSREWSISREYKGREIELGRLRVTAGLDPVLAGLRDRVLVTLATQAGSTLIIAGFLFLVMHLFVTRHLVHVARQARELGPERLDQPVRVDRRRWRRADELDVLVDALNEMRGRLSSAYHALLHHRRRLEEAVEQRTASLALTNDRLRLLLHHFPGAVWTTDERLRVTSRAGGRASGPDAPPGPEDGDDRALEAHRCALKGERGAYELQVGEREYVVQVEPLRGGRGRGTLAIALDVTEQRRLEAERLGRRLQESARLESLGILAGGIAHDFNNLLVGILGNAGLALRRLPPDDPARDLVERIETTAQRASELTQQMLAYSGKGRFVVRPLDVSELVREMASLLEVSISKMITLELALADDLPAVDADATQLRQVVMNLITNASDAIGDRPGTIQLETRLEDVPEATRRPAISPDGALSPGRYVVLVVSDSGCGMDEEVRRRMFDPFFTAKEGGHGLGLAATQGIVRGHRGAIDVDSAPGAGTVVRVMLPASKAARRRPAEEAPAPQQVTAGGTVLVVDDEAIIRDFTASALTMEGFEVLSADDGEEAVRVYRHHGHRIDLVILDMTMPRMGGRETFAELRRMNPDVRVLLTSGFDEEEAVTGFVEGGLAGFLQKPYRATTLLEQVQMALSGTRHLGDATRH